VLSGDRLLVELALSGRLHGDELCRWLAPLGIDGQAAVLVFQATDAEHGLSVLDRLLGRDAMPAVTATCDGLLCAVVACADPLTLAARCRSELCERLGEVRAAASRPVPVSAVALGYREARSALAAARASNGSAPDVASYEDLGALKLLLALQSRQSLETYCQSVLGPVEGQGHDYGEELLRSADSFIEHNGHWEHAARALYCHRHTLRYRIRRVEQLTNRDLSCARDRIELWLALRGRELVR
jgi:PucR family transcriptional regulator, purine catabolism regulatory protein